MKENIDELTQLTDEAFEILNAEVDKENYKPQSTLPEEKSQLLESLLDKHKLKGSLKLIIHDSCAELIPKLTSPDLLDESKEDLKAERLRWDNIVENLQGRLNTASSETKKRVRSMIKGASREKGNLQAIKATKQKPINAHMKPIAFHLYWLGNYQRANIVDFIYDLYCTFEYEDYGKSHEEDSLYSKLSSKEQKKENNALKREGKRLIFDWYRSTFDELEIP